MSLRRKLINMLIARAEARAESAKKGVEVAKKRAEVAKISAEKAWAEVHALQSQNKANSVGNPTHQH